MNQLKEEPLPPPTPPVIVEDEEYSQQPTDDRVSLLHCIQSLAQKTHEALARDSLVNSRYARRLQLSNRIRSNVRKREEFDVILPLDKSCWNDVDLETIEYLMISTILNNVDDDHVWFKVRACFDQFISQAAKDYMDKMDQESYEEQIGENHDSGPIQQTISVQTTRMRVGIPEQHFSPPACTEQVIVDEDDDIEIVYSSGPKK